MKYLTALLTSTLALLLVVGCSLAPNTSQSAPPTTTVQVQQTALSLAPAPQGTVQVADFTPAPASTVQYPLPGITPTRPEPTATPTLAMLEPARLITATTVSTATFGLDLDFRVEGTIRDTEAVESLVWSPYGDGFLYVTASGKLYWSDISGANRTLLYTYAAGYFEWDALGDQMPLGNTMYLVHQGGATNEGGPPGHMDIVRFAKGQIPTFDHVEHLPVLWDTQWWRPDRASGVLLASYVQGGYVGGDRLITLDAAGQVVDDRNIPYMGRGFVQPHGEWLAYSTNQQATDVGFNGSEPSTAYLLNLRTGERLQISPSGQGDVASWSPDGKWLITSCGVLSMDGSERICLPGRHGNDVAWSRDSKRLAASWAGGGCDDNGCMPAVSGFYVVDLPSRKVAHFDAAARAARGVSHIQRPRWSPDGSLMAVLAFDPVCPTCLPGQSRSGASSEPKPAIYLLSFDPDKSK